MWFLKGLPSPWRARALFHAKRYTMTNPERCRSLWDLSRRALRSGTPGCFVECGVWKGGSAAIMGLALQRWGASTNLHLFDSFQGLPEPTEEDGVAARQYSGGRNSGSLVSIHQCKEGLEPVRDYLLSRLKLPAERTHFHPGWFQHTIPQIAPTLGPIALLRLDGDWYESTRICLEHLYPLLSPGGIVILDDYNFWEGCRRATDEYRQSRGLTAEIQQIDAEAVFWVNPG